MLIFLARPSLSSCIKVPYESNKMTSSFRRATCALYKQNYYKNAIFKRTVESITTICLWRKHFKALNRFTKRAMTSSVCRVPCTKSFTSKTTTEIYVFMGILNRTSKIYKLDFLRVVALICSSKVRLAGLFRSSCNSRKYVTVFKKLINGIVNLFSCDS